MRIARKHYPHVLLGFGNNSFLKIPDGFNDFNNCVARVQTNIELSLIVTGTGRVHFASDRSHNLCHASFDCHLNVFIGHIKYKTAVLNFLTDGIQTFQNFLRFLLSQNFLCSQHMNMRRATDNRKRCDSFFDQNRGIEFLHQMIHRQIKSSAPHCFRHG